MKNNWTKMRYEEKNSNALLRLQQPIVLMRERYGIPESFLETFTPELQSVVVKEWVRAYTGVAPTLEVVATGYGEDLAIVWICIQLEDVNLFTGAREKMDVKCQKKLSQLILSEYPYLKVTEIMLFFHRLKCGRYGRFYGTVDALFISSALLSFMEERARDLRRIQEEKEKRQKTAVPPSGGITYDEYLRLKSLKSNTYERE